MPAQKIEFMYEIPDEYRFVGYRKANEGECYLRYGKVLIVRSENGSEWLIVERILDCERSTENTKRHKHADAIHAWAEGAIIQFTGDQTGRLWIDCFGNNPAWIIKFRNWLTKSGRIAAWNSIVGNSAEDRTEFKRWIGDWQSVEVEE